jgi:hypothetical protein
MSYRSHTTSLKAFVESYDIVPVRLSDVGEVLTDAFEIRTTGCEPFQKPFGGPGPHGTSNFP